MKKVYTFFFAVLITASAFAQVPQKMSYQAVIRNSSGVLVTNHAVGMKISILQGSASGTVVFSETYSPNPQTNANGLLTVEIGSGSAITGTFTGINWTSGPYFLKTETDPVGGTNYAIVGTSQLLSVPFAMYSKTAQTADYNNLTNLPNLSGYLTSESDPVFVASPAHGIINGNITNWNTAFGWGNHVGLYRPVSYVPAWSEITGKPAFAAVATSGTFADLLTKPTTLAGYGITDGGFILPYAGTASSATPVFQVINNGTGEGIKSVAVSAGKTGIIGEAPNQGILGNATATTGTAYGVQGTSASTTGSGMTGFGSSTTGQNFGVRGLSSSNEGKGIYGYTSSITGTTYGVYGESSSTSGNGICGKATSITGQTYGVYGETASSSGTGVFGFAPSTTGRTFGVYGESSSTSGNGIYGKATSITGPTYGVYGETASSSGTGVKGYAPSTTGTTYGVYGVSASSSGYGVYGEGKTAFYGTTSATNGYGIYVVCTDATNYPRGVYSSVASDNGYSGYFIGGKFFVSGNVGIGTGSPNYKLDVTGAVNLNNGVASGQALFVNNAEALWYNGTYFSWGYGAAYNFFQNKVTIGNSASPGYMLYVQGSAYATGTWSSSDVRLKKNISPISNALGNIQKIRGSSFEFRNDEFKDYQFAKGRQFGFIAQELEEVFPEMVNTDSNGYKSVNYSEMIPVLLEAVKEQQNTIQKLGAENDQMKARLEKIEYLLSTKTKESRE